MSEDRALRGVWPTRFEPEQDITTYELALDMKYVNGSHVLMNCDLPRLGSALRHRVDDVTGERMDRLYERSLALTKSESE